MGLWRKKRIQNAGSPKGFWGRRTLLAMNKGHDALTDWGLGLLTIDGDDHVLDVGCGGGRTVKKLAKATTETVWGVDPADAAIDASYRTNRREIRADKVMICKADVAELPFDDGFFDVVTAVETIYFWPDLTAGCREIFRVLKPGGRVMLLTEGRADGDDVEKWAEIATLIDVKLPTADGVAAALKAAGFCGTTAYIRGDALCVIAEKQV